ncbi:MAG: DUF6034 family protein, partial [Eubacteriales bacterium]|nr:DUF6034 family protein [Eubacteriales bacterium]
LLSACQPNPETAIVVSKNSERLIDQAEDGSKEGTAALSIPSDHVVFTETGADGNLTITADAAVDVPAADQLPMTRVTSKGFDQSIVTQIFQTVFAGQTVFDHSSDAGRSKADIEKSILQMQQQLSDGSYEQYGFSEEEWNDLISKLEEDYIHAPDEVEAEKTITDGTMLLSGEDQYQFSELNAVSDTGSLRVRSNLNNKFADESSLVYSRNNAPTYTMLDAVEVPVDSNSKPETDEKVGYALSKAIDFCSNMFRSNTLSLKLAAVYLVNDRSTGLSDDEAASAQHYAYKLFYVREVAGVPVAVDAAMGMNEDPYNIRWSYEQVEAVFDRNGIASLNWGAPLSNTEMLKQNVKVISLDRANEIFKMMAHTVYEPQAKPLNPKVKRIEIDVKIDEIQLRLLRIREQNTEGTRTGILVPAWVYYGSVRNATEWEDPSQNTIVYQGSSNQFGNMYYWGPTIVLAINAVDGSIIDTAIGY